MSGYLPRISRRPSRSDYRDIAKSGHIFAYEETESGIKRWTDGVRWSPSRTRDGFMLYRELDEQHAKGSSGRQALPSHERPVDSVTDAESGLFGSLIDSYHFRENGLMKKTISVRLGESCWRLVSYYQVGDVTSGGLQRPFEDERLWSVRPNEDLRHAMQCWDAPEHIGIALHGHLGHASSTYGFAPVPNDYVDGTSTAQYAAEQQRCFGAHAG